MREVLTRVGVACGLAALIVAPQVFSPQPAVPDGAPPLRSDGGLHRAERLVPPPPAAPVPPKAPDDVRAVYLTAWSAATPSRVQEALALIRSTELNGVVIDVKDYTGRVAFATRSPLIQALGAERPLYDLEALVRLFHAEGGYVAVRIAAFQDQHLVRVRPDLAVRDGRGRIWRDRKGLGWVDPASREVWDYLVAIGRAAARAGVDELNFDYIRFPSDGDLRSLRYPVYEPAAEERRQVLRRFFGYLTSALRPTGVVLSADVFGLVTVRPDDLGVGQVLEDVLPYFDYVAPMVYPSHYARGFLGLANPAAHPYQVVHYSLSAAQRRRQALAAALIPDPPQDPPGPALARIRPWLQGFDLGAPYPPAVIRRQMDAASDAGLTWGWYLWNPSNRYLQATFLPEPTAAGRPRAARPTPAPDP
ncbi:MAG: putative glycoside hydrolase [Armatimonadota bacterium]|nr:putative glycoside hydrolase [Armatimonadota bacterium]MDR7404919.1 putative glycoside hydrolase [Armatimonadota bacterium]